MVGTTRFELATSPTPILENTQLEQLSETHQYVRDWKTIRRNAYWTRNGPADGPTLVYSTQTRYERQPARVQTQHLVDRAEIRIILAKALDHLIRKRIHITEPAPAK
jgi:hypothetical protein